MTCERKLSLFEGFEVKVTEAIWKGVPVIVYESGGIPLQIKNEEQGFVVPVGKVQDVADILWRSFFDS